MNEKPQFKAGTRRQAWQAKLHNVGFVFSWGSRRGKFMLDIPAEKY